MKITIFLLNFLCGVGLCAAQNGDGNSKYLSMEAVETSYPYAYPHERDISARNYGNAGISYSRYLYNYYRRYPYAYNNPYSRYPHNGHNRARVYNRGYYRPYSSGLSGILGIFGGLGFGGYGGGYGSGIRTNIFGGDSIINQYQNNYNEYNHYDDHSSHFYDDGDSYQSADGSNSASNSDANGFSNGESDIVGSDNVAEAESGDVGGDFGGDVGDADVGSDAGGDAGGDSGE